MTSAMTARPEAPQPKVRTVPIMVSLMLALIPLQMDALVAATALPSIAGDLGEFDKLAWITTSYLLTMAIGTIASGRIGDMFGRRRTLLVALWLFLLGSLGSGLAPGMTSLVGARALQGLGAGMIFTTLMAVIAEIAPPDKRSRYQSTIAVVAPLSMIVGPWVGGLINDHLGWRWIFLLNVPLIALAIVGAMAFVRLARRPAPGQVDVAGLVTVTIMSVGIVLVGAWGGSQYAWGSPQVIGAGVAAVAGLIGLIAVERRAANPVLPLALFTRRPVVASFAVLALGMGAVMMAAINFLPVFMQIVQHRSASNSGLLLLPMLLPAIAVSIIVGRWTTGAGRFRVVLVTGTVALTLGVASLTTLDSGSSGLFTAACMVLAGAGIGMLFQTPIVIVQNSVARHEVGAATGTANFLRTVGGALGVGALGSAFSARIAGRTKDGLGRTGFDVGSLDPQQIAALPHHARIIVEQAVTSANGQLFGIATVMCLVAVVAAIFVGRPRQHDDA